jgi:hypothetical protein
MVASREEARGVRWSVANLGWPDSKLRLQRAERFRRVLRFVAPLHITDIHHHMERTLTIAHRVTQKRAHEGTPSHSQVQYARGEFEADKASRLCSVG